MHAQPSTDSQVSCYKPVMIKPGQVSLDHLRERAPLLSQLAEHRSLSPAVIERVLPAIKSHLQRLRSASDKPDDSEEIISQVENSLAAIEKLLGEATGGPNAEDGE